MQHPENTAGNADKKMPPASTGNASNPSPRNDAPEPAADNQLLDPQAEKYLRESGNIEDIPDAQDQQESEKNNG